MPDLTTRLSLKKPTGLEPRSRVPLNENFDKLDEWAGTILVNDGVTPPDVDLFDGAIVKEKTSGICWVAQKNGGGTYDKAYISYPYLFRAGTTGTTITTGTTYQGKGATTYLNGKNSSSAQINGSNFWVCPRTGLYLIRAMMVFATNGTGNRSVVLNLDGTDRADIACQTLPGNATQSTHVGFTAVIGVNLNQIIGTRAWQDSGGTRGLDVLYEIAMISSYSP